MSLVQSRLGAFHFSTCPSVHSLNDVYQAASRWNSSWRNHCSVRIWMRPRVIVGNRYRMEEGEVEVDSIQPIGFPDITPALARESGFLGLVDLLKVAKHGKGENIYLVRFHFVPPRARRPG